MVLEHALDPDHCLLLISGVLTGLDVHVHPLVSSLPTPLIETSLPVTSTTSATMVNRVEA